MLYQRKSFQVPATNGNPTMCDSAGHAMLDLKGKCLRCGEVLRLAGAHMVSGGYEAVGGSYVEKDGVLVRE